MDRRIALEWSAVTVTATKWEALVAEEVDMDLTAKPEPRGDVRIVFAQDGSITRYPLWDAPSPEDERHRAQQLRRAVADLACAGVDVLAQSVFTAAGAKFFRPEHPDHVHQAYPIDPPQEEGVEAIEILIDECHKRGM